MDNKNLSLNKSNWLFSAFLAVLLTGVVLLILFKVEQLAPFGNNSLAVMDARIQYLDFFSYYKDLLEGKAELVYSFGKTLGGTNIAVFSYYLSSPINFLVRFWEKENLNTFFDVVVLLKLSLCAATCGTFLKLRFCELKNIFAILLAFSYAMMQYNFAQSSNIMWFDGVYMLPLMLLGVYYLVHRNSGILLSVSVGLAILFNWYSAGINCIFSIFWCGIELLYKYELSKGNIPAIFKKIGLYGFHMALGVGISAALFLPTVFALKEGKGSFDWDNLISGFTGNILTIIQNLTTGATSSKGSVSLFCGSFVVIGFIAYFLGTGKNKREKKINIFMVIVTVLIFYFMPFCFVFSLLKSVGSYWYRYSYVGVWVLIFIAADFYTGWDIEVTVNGRILLKSGIGFSCVLLILDFANSVWKINQTYLTIMCYAAVTLLLLWLKKGKKLAYNVLSGILCAVVVGDLGYNAHNLIEIYRARNVDEYHSYVKEQKELAEQLKEIDTGFYRVNQTLTRNMKSNNLTANYNEGLAFDYNSIASYTSAPENIQLEFLERLGYRINGAAMNIVNTSVIPADSLLGVKYVFAHEAINGLTVVPGSLEKNKKLIYENPYCLPNAFIYKNSNIDYKTLKQDNPFLFQNALYSKLVGHEVEIYKKIDFNEKNEAQTKIYSLSVPDKKAALYGNLKASKEMMGELYVDGQFRTAYSEWLAPSVFYIPFNDNKDTVEVSLQTKEDSDEIVEAQFYYVDLEYFQDIVCELEGRKAEKINITPGRVWGNIQGGDDDLLYLNIPYHEQWTITCNGNEIEPILFGECLMSIPLQAGDNEIEMIYQIKGLKMGVIASILSICLLMICAMGRRKNKCFQ